MAAVICGLVSVRADRATQSEPCRLEATTRLDVAHPCGHHWDLETCPGHAEGVIGDNDPTNCPTCGHYGPCVATLPAIGRPR